MKKVNPRQRRKYRIRKTIFGSTERPRLSVFRSDRYTYAQVIVDSTGKTLFGLSTKDEEIRSKISEGSVKSVSAAKVLGEAIGAKCKEQSIDTLTFDRNGFLYHGRVQAVADGVREAGVNL